MGKKGKRAGKSSEGKAKQGTGKARRERAALQRDVEARIAALVTRLEEELKDADMFGPYAEREDCPICFVPMPQADADLTCCPCCGKIICAGCNYANVKKRLRGCSFCRTETGKNLLDDKEMLLSRAEAKDINAMVALASVYGRGSQLIPKDELSSNRLLVEAAEQGHLFAL